MARPSSVTAGENIFSAFLSICNNENFPPYHYKFGKEDSTFCQIINKASITGQRLLKFCQSGERKVQKCLRTTPSYVLLLKWAKPGLFLFFSQCNDKNSTKLTINDKSVGGVLGTRTL